MGIIKAGVVDFYFGKCRLPMAKVVKLEERGMVLNGSLQRVESFPGLGWELVLQSAIFYHFSFKKSSNSVVDFSFP